MAEQAAGRMRPLPALTFLQTGPPAPSWPHRTFHLALHLMNVSLVWGLARRFLSTPAAQVAAFVFALHPIQVEAVCALPARGILLAAGLSLAVLHCWIRQRFWLATVVFAAAPLAHEQAAALPLVLMLTRAAPGWPPLRPAPVAAMALFSTLAILRSAHPPLDFEAFSRCGVAVLRYLWLLLAPLSLTPAPDLAAPPPAAWLAWGALAALVALFATALQRTPHLLWPLAGLALVLPASALLPAQEMGADRLMYLPMTAFSFAVGIVFAAAPRKALALAGALLMLTSFAQVRTWSDEKALWTDAARHAPRLTLPLLRLAALSTPLHAVELLEEARRVEPGSAAVAAGLALAYLRAGLVEPARAEALRARSLDPCDAQLRAVEGRLGIVSAHCGATGGQ